MAAQSQIVRIDPDALTIIVGAAEPVTCTQDEIAALWLTSDGFSRADLDRYFGDDTAAWCDSLSAKGIDLEAPVALEVRGHDLSGDPVCPSGRHISGRLLQRAADFPSEDALLIETPNGSVENITTSELSELVQDVASRLRGDGLKPGDHIAIASSPSLERITLAIAAWEVGLSVVILRPTLSPETISVVAQAIQPKIWFMERIRGLPSDARLIDPDPDTGGAALERWMQAGTFDKTRPDHDPDREAVVLTSSGSTGQPKMLALSQRGLYRSGRYAMLTEEPAVGARVSASIDMSAISGLRIYSVLPALGRTTTFIPTDETRAQSLAFFLSVGKNDVSHVRVVPAGLRAMVQVGATRIAQLGLSALRTISSGGSALSPRVAAAASEMFDAAILDHYGMTETSGSFGCVRDAAVTGRGVVLRDMLTRIARPDGQPVAPGEIGELQFFDASLYLGQHTSDGYMPRSRGWFTCNDMAFRGASGEVVIAGRSDGMLKTIEGEWLSPTAITRLAMEHEDVQDAVVLAVGDEVDRVGYALVLESSLFGPDISIAIKERVSRVLGQHATPTHVLVIPELPRLNQSKPDLIALRQMLAEGSSSST